MRAVQLRKREEGRAELCRAAARCDTSIVLNVEECLCACVCLSVCVCVCVESMIFLLCVLCDIYIAGKAFVLDLEEVQVV